MKGRSPTPISYGPERARMPLPPTPGQQQPQQTQPQQPPHQASQAPAAQQRCDSCTRCLQDLRRQALLLSVPNPRNRDLMLMTSTDSPSQHHQQQMSLAATVAQQLRVNHRHVTITADSRSGGGHCARCGTHMQQLTLEATAQTAQMTTSSSTTGLYHQSTGSSSSSNCGGGSGSSHYRVGSPKHVTFAGNLTNRLFRQSQSCSPAPSGSYSPQQPHQHQQQQALALTSDSISTMQQQQQQSPSDLGYAHSPKGQQPQSPNSNRKKRHHTQQQQQQQQQPQQQPQQFQQPSSAATRFGTHFSECLRSGLPPVPAELLSSADACQGGVGPQALGRVKVVVKVVSKDPSAASNMAMDSRRRQITVFDTTPQYHRGQGPHKVPKIFGYDSVFTEENTLPELCSSALPDIIQGVVNGTDGCVFIFGYGNLGKSHTMLGSDVSPASLGVIPCAIAWLFHLIQEQKSQSATARFSVRVSAVEVHGRDENLRDLLAEVGRSSADPPPPAAAPYLREDPISGAQLENQSELRAPTAEKAAGYLDAALSCRSQARDGMSHLLFTLHLYQYRVERSGAGRGVAGGRSRLHLIDLGSGRTSRDSGHPALSLAALGSVLMSLVNGQRHIPHRDSKLSQLLREAMGSLACRACMICQVSSDQQFSTESLQILQLANKIQKLRRRRAKLASNSSDSSSCDSFGVRRAGRLRPQMGLVASAASRLNAVTSQSEAEYSSSSEQSCDTVIFRGRHEDAKSDAALMRKLAQASSGDDSDTGTETSSGRRVPRTNARARPSLGGRLVGRMTAVEALSTQREQWIDGPNAEKSAASGAQMPPSSPVPQLTPQLPQLLEAPSPLEAPQQPGERWIDGPNASPPTTEERRHPLMHSSHQETPICDLSNTQLLQQQLLPQQPPPPPQRKDAETQSDEPYESESSASTYSTMDRDNQRVLSDISERTEETSGKSGLEEDAESSGEKSASDTCGRRVVERAVGDDERRPAAAADDEDGLNNEALERIEIPSEVIPPPTVFATPSTAIARVAAAAPTIDAPSASFVPHQHQQRLSSSLPRPLSRGITKEGCPSGMSSATEGPSAPSSPPPPPPPPPPFVPPVAASTVAVAVVAGASPRVKPFVRDWVEKHSALSSSESSCCCLCCGEDAAPDGSGLCGKPECGRQQQQQQQRHQSHHHQSLQHPHPHQQQQPQLSQSARSSPSHTLIRRSGQHRHQPSAAAAMAAGASVSLQATPTHHQHQLHQHRSRSSRRLQQQQPPPPPPSHARVAQWLEGVQPDDLSRAVEAAAAALSASTGPASLPLAPSVAAASVTDQQHRRQSSDITVASTISSSAATSSAAAPKTSPSLLTPQQQPQSPPPPPNQTASGHTPKKSSSRLASFLTSPLFGKRSSKSAAAAAAPVIASVPAPVASPAQTSGSSRRHHRAHQPKEVTPPLLPTATIPMVAHSPPAPPPVIPSPYHTVTQPRVSVHSSSGHGSDCSSYNPLAHHYPGGVVAGVPVVGGLTAVRRCVTGGASSGYESMLRDSEASSCHDSASERSLPAVPRSLAANTAAASAAAAAVASGPSSRRKSSHHHRKSGASRSRSRSAPSAEDELAVGGGDEAQKLAPEAELREMERQIRCEKVTELLWQQEQLKKEMLQAKGLLMADRAGWNFDLHVADSMDPESPGFLEALRKETLILRKRVHACKSHLMFVSCFDAKASSGSA